MKNEFVIDYYDEKNTACTVRLFAKNEAEARKIFQTVYSGSMKIESIVKQDIETAEEPDSD